MLTAISAIIIFFILVGIHEFGHFAAAKLCGVKVLEFSLGMGPAVFKKQGKETLYSFRILPIGGFCKMEGEEESSNDPRSFSQKGPLKRFIVLVSGAMMNIILGFLVFIIMFSMINQVGSPVIDSFVENSPMIEAGFQKGDVITKIDGTSVHIPEDIYLKLFTYKGGELEIQYKRNGEKKTAMLTPMNVDGMYYLGFKQQIKQLNFFTRTKNAFFYSIFTVKLVFASLGMLITGAVPASEMSGPVGIVKEIGTAAHEGIRSLLYLTGLITINLGVFNLLPLPALDGGHIIFVIIEAIRRKKIPPEKEGIVHAIGFALLFGLMIFATWNDIMRLITGA